MAAQPVPPRRIGLENRDAEWSAPLPARGQVNIPSFVLEGGGETSLSPAPSSLPSYTSLMARPKRQLTGYNIFFQQERQRLLENLPDKDSDTTPGIPRRRPRKNRSTRRPHRKIGFAELGRTIAAKWRALSKEEKDHYNTLAARDKVRHALETQIWKEAYGEHDTCTGTGSTSTSRNGMYKKEEEHQEDYNQKEQEATSSSITSSNSAATSIVMTRKDTGNAASSFPPSSFSAVLQHQQHQYPNSSLSNVMPVTHHHADATSNQLHQELQDAYTASLISLLQEEPGEQTRTVFSPFVLRDQCASTSSTISLTGGRGSASVLSSGLQQQMAVVTGGTGELVPQDATISNKQHQDVKNKKFGVLGSASNGAEESFLLPSLLHATQTIPAQEQPEVEMGEVRRKRSVLPFLFGANNNTNTMMNLSSGESRTPTTAPGTIPQLMLQPTTSETTCSKTADDDCDHNKDECTEDHNKDIFLLLPDEAQPRPILYLNNILQEEEDKRKQRSRHEASSLSSSHHSTAVMPPEHVARGHPHHCPVGPIDHFLLDPRLLQTLSDELGQEGKNEIIDMMQWFQQQYWCVGG